jgi:hypothetical protein
MPKHPQIDLVLLDGEPWVEKEMATLRLGDRRREKRVKKILADFGAQPEASIPRASGNWAATKATYRCLSQEKVDGRAVLLAHRQASLERGQDVAVLLAVQDTTTLNFSTHPRTGGLGPVGNNRDKTIGLLLHSTLLLREDGQALGVLAAEFLARDPKAFKAGPAGARNRKALADKESAKWLRSLEATQAAAPALAGSLLLNIADREGDIYELFWHHAQWRGATAGTGGAQVELLIRSQHNRALDAGAGRLFESLAAQPVAASYGFEAPRRPGEKSRQVTLRLRYTQVHLPPPPDQVKYQGHREALSLWAIEAREENPPRGRAPICWRLLSTLPVLEAETARAQVQRYSQRWQIEVFHKVLKSGCKIEERQLESAARLQRCLTLDLIVAWRVLALSKAARHAAPDSPPEPVSQWLEEHQWKALWCHVHRRTTPPTSTPSTKDAQRWIAQLGGFLARKGDGHPGPMTLWRGLQRLNDIADAYLLFTQNSKDVGNA